MRASSAFLSCVCAALVLASCTKTKTEPRTEILIRVDAGALVRGMADHLRVELSSGAGEEKLVEVDPELFDVSRASFHWPASLALVAKPSHASYAFEVSATAEKDGKALARARVRSKFIGGKTLLLDVVLQDVCIGRLDCASDETCVADGDQAKCVPATVKPETLHELKPGTDAGGEALPGNQDAAPGDGGGNSDSGSGNTGKEDCWNGSDDDDDGDIDCADSDCKPVAVCVPEGDRVGALVPKSSACPAHFDGTKTLLHQGLQDDGCTGCSCTADTNCVSDVFYFPDDASCTSATFPYGAAYYIGTVGIAVCDAQHLTMNPLTTNFASPAGWAAGKFRATDSCQAMGTAEPVVPSWSKSDNFC
ncbi:MAG TPA: hypothetical protein VHM19_00140, partial [Polyangiales bacterium]|nr:hypothetical protein [Polyangiales bacterium]